ncbi:MAG: glutaminase A [Beijerinckiaceae bacterium]
MNSNTANPAEARKFEGAFPVRRFLNECHREFSDDHGGRLADYIPELAKANPAHFGIALATVDGHVHEVGDTGVEFTIQSVSKAFVFALALELAGPDRVAETTGFEPSGEAFNSIRLKANNRPFNPMVNAGAIACSALVHELDPEGSFERVRALLSRFAGRDLAVDENVFNSERETGDRNRAIAWLLRNHGVLKGDVDAALDVYFRQCSILVTARDVAIMGATLAGNGVNPVTCEVVVTPATVARTMSVMVSAGMYDFAGEWIYRVGLPAKSGVGGGIVATLPAQFGLGTFSPLLDAQGNSARGLKVCERLSEYFGLHLLRRAGDVSSCIAASYDLRQVSSRRNRHKSERDLIDQHGVSVFVLELAGVINFASADFIARTIASAGGRAMLIFDMRRVAGFAYAAVRIFSELFTSVSANGARIILSGVPETGPVASAIRDAVSEDIVPGSRRLRTVDDAVEWAEDQIVFMYGGFGRAIQSVELSDQFLMTGLTSDDLDAVRSLMTQESFRPGSHIIRTGEEASRIYFLQSGMVSVSLDNGTRLATLGPGTCFGEFALLSPKARRSADVVCDTNVACLVMTLDAYDRLRELRPGACEAILRNLGSLLAERLRQANSKISALTS